MEGFRLWGRGFIGIRVKNGSGGGFRYLGGGLKKRILGQYLVKLWVLFNIS